MTAVPGHDVTGYILDVGGRQAARVDFATPAAARAAYGALSRVGYDAAWPAGAGERQVIVRGWSEDRLAARLDALRGVLLDLSGDPMALAGATLDRLAGIPPGRLPGADGLEHFARIAAEEIAGWISETAGPPALDFTRVPAADGLAAMQLNTARQLEAVINGHAARALAVAQLSLRRYTELRGQMSHGRARAEATRQAGIAFGIRVPAEKAAQAGAARPAAVTAREFPAAAPLADGGSPAEPTRPRSGDIARRPGRRPR